MKKIRLYIKLLKLKCKIILKIIRHKGSFCVLYINDTDLLNIIENKKVEKLNASYYRMMEHQMWQLLHNASAEIDDVELITQKATFEAEFEIHD